MSHKRYRVVRTTDRDIPIRRIAYFELDAAWRAADQYARFDKAPVRVVEVVDGEEHHLATYTLVGREVEVTTP